MSQRDERSTPLELRGMTGWLIQRAARRAPDSLAPRLEEEWLADLAARSSALSRLRFAVGCCWASRVIMGEYPRTEVRATSAAVEAGGLIAVADRNLSYFSLRSGTLFLVAGLHGALFYGLINMLSHAHRSSTPSDLQNQILKPVPPETVPLPPPQFMKLKTWVIDVPPPLIKVPTRDETEKQVATQVAGQSAEPHMPPSPPEPTGHVVRQVAGGPGAGFPDTADFYPSLSARLGEEGMSTVRVCVDPNGRLIADPSTVKSSGSARLDEGALKLARAGSGHYRATTEDGRPVSSCYSLGIRFQLKK